GLDREQAEAELGDQVLEKTVLELEELARPVSRLAKRYDAGLAHHLADRGHVGEAVARFRRDEPRCVLRNELDGLAGGRTPAGDGEIELGAPAHRSRLGGAIEAGVADHGEIGLACGEPHGDLPSAPIGTLHTSPDTLLRRPTSTSI